MKSSAPTALRGLDHFLVAGIEPPVADVVGHRAAKKEGLLEHDAHLAAQRRQLDVADIAVVDGHPAGHDVVGAVEQLDQGALARPGRPDQRHRLAWLDAQLDVVQHRDLRLVGEVDVFERHLPLDGRHLRRSRPALHLGLAVEQSEQPLAAGHGRLQGVVALGQVTDGVEEAADVEHEGHQHAPGDVLAQGRRSAKADGQGHCHRAQEIDAGEKGRRQPWRASETG